MEQAKEQREEFEQFSKSFSPETLKAWEQMAEAWEADHLNSEDPYVAQQDCTSFLPRSCHLSLIQPRSSH